MNFIGNVLWLIFGGLLTALMYLLGAILLCITIVGIPFGLQVAKLSYMALSPFGKESIVTSQPTGCLSTLMNILWILIGGLWIAIAHLVMGVLLCISIIGIPFGLQHFKLMTMALTPFGREVVTINR